MSRMGGLLPDGQQRFPRVSGDEPVAKALVCPELTFSPRERG